MTATITCTDERNRYRCRRIRDCRTRRCRVVNTQAAGVLNDTYTVRLGANICQNDNEIPLWEDKWKHCFTSGETATEATRIDPFVSKLMPLVAVRWPIHGKCQTILRAEFVNPVTSINSRHCVLSPLKWFQLVGGVKIASRRYEKPVYQLRL